MTMRWKARVVRDVVIEVDETVIAAQRFMAARRALYHMSPMTKDAFAALCREIDESQREFEGLLEEGTK